MGRGLKGSLAVIGSGMEAMTIYEWSLAVGGENEVRKINLAERRHSQDLSIPSKLFSTISKCTVVFHYEQQEEMVSNSCTSL